jgi:hypothetical protein
MQLRSRREGHGPQEILIMEDYRRDASASLAIGAWALLGHDWMSAACPRVERPAPQ